MNIGYEFDFCGARLTALGSGALWWADHGLLCVSDLHLGKAERIARRGGTARHDAVAWGYARGASQRGVEIHQQTEVTGIDVQDGEVCGVQTNRGFIQARKVLSA
ncbi:FAD-dependent oxidoreductase, partial [uncultured Sulfitobacter sp.]|uniref:FAD-dependent oxidoreductase n=1 Tax=uncultured Sulfitobacter sp. TaxID=191468 RepID=UPI00259A69D4